MTVTAANNYAIAPLDAHADRDVVRELWRRNLPTADAARWEWLYERGPARGFLLHTAGGVCVGSCGYMRRTMRIDGRSVVAGQAIDLNVDAEHRTIGPALKLQRAVASTVGPDGLRLMYAFPNAQSESVLQRLGYRSLGTFERWAKLLRSESRLRGRIRSQWLSKAAAFAVDAGMRIAHREPTFTPPPGTRFELVERFDRRFDDLDRRVGSARPIAGERTADYLNWRFAERPGGAHRALLMLDGGGAAAAYMVFHRRDDAVSIDDLSFADVAAWPVLVAEFLRRMRLERAAAVTVAFLGPAEPLDVLQRFGFWRRPSKWNVLVHSAEPDAAATRRLLQPERWWLTRADVDTDE